MGEKFNISDVDMNSAFVSDGNEEETGSFQDRS